MNFNENDPWRDKTELLNFRLSKLPNTKVLLHLEFDTEDQVLYFLLTQFLTACVTPIISFLALLGPNYAPCMEC